MAACLLRSYSCTRGCGPSDSASHVGELLNHLDIVRTLLGDALRRCPHGRRLTHARRSLDKRGQAPMPNDYWNRTLSQRIGRRRAIVTTGVAAASAAFLAACGGGSDNGGGGGSKDKSSLLATL